jgi:hypothetical protein
VDGNQDINFQVDVANDGPGVALDVQVYAYVERRMKNEEPGGGFS